MKFDHDPISDWDAIEQTGTSNQNRSNIVDRRRFLMTSAGSAAILGLLASGQRIVSALELPTLPKFPDNITNLLALSAEQLKAYTSPNELGQKLIAHNSDTGEGSYQIALFSDIFEQLKEMPFDERGLGSRIQRINAVETTGPVQTLLSIFKERVIDLRNPPTLADVPNLPQKYFVRFAIGTLTEAHEYIDSISLDPENIPNLNLMQFTWTPNPARKALSISSARAFLPDTRQEFKLFPNRSKVPPRQTPGVQAPQS